VDDKLTQLVRAQQAQIKYLQDEYANLIVQGKFDKQTSQTFRALQKHTSGLNSQALHNLRLATAVSGVAGNGNTTTVNAGIGRGNTPRRDRWNGRGARYNGYRPRRGQGQGYYNNSQDMFDHFAQKSPADTR
jgi:hypothetical protein